MIKNLTLSFLITLAASINVSAQSIDAGSQFKHIEEMCTNAATREVLIENNVVKAHLGKQYVDALIDINNTDAIAKLKAIGAVVNTEAGGVATISIPTDKLGELAKIGADADIRIARPLFPMLDNAKATTGVNVAQAGTGLEMPYMGENVIIGIIDSGFQYNHSAFYDYETGKSRITRIWEQRCDTTASLQPDKFAYGCEYAPGKASLGRPYDLITSTHGTHVAGIAAGGDTRFSNPYFGVAPKSEIVLVSTKATDATVLDAVKYIFDYADSQNKPCVINISLGTYLGPHDGTSSVDRMLDAMQGEGKLIVGAAGNGGGDIVHLGKTFSIKDHSLKTALEFTSYNSTKLGMVEIWGTANKKFKLRVAVFDKSTNKELASIEGIDPFKDETKKLNYKGTPDGASEEANVDVYVSANVNETNNKPNAYLQAVCTGIDKKQIFLTIEVTASTGTVDMWNDGNYSSFNNIGNPEYSAGDDSYTVAEVGGTGNKIISVGSFNTKNSYTTLEGKSGGTSYTIGAISPFSSKGPTIDGRVKPEITAPGSLIVSAYNRYYAGFKATSMVSSLSYNDIASYYGAMQGTSMASPFVTGSMALWLGADRSLTPERAKEILRQSAINDKYTGNIRTSGDSQWGYGKLDVLNGLKLCIAGSSVEGVESENQGYSISAENGKLTIVPATDANDVTITVFDCMGRTVANSYFNAVEALSPIEILNIPNGALILNIKSASTNSNYKILAK